MPGIRRLRTKGRVGAILLIVGVLPWLYSVLRLHLHTWTPLFTRTSLASKQFISPAFRTDLSGIYDVTLISPRPQNESRLDCLAGEHFNHECDAIPRSLFLRWSLLDENGTVVESATYEPSLFSGSYEEFGVGLGSFQAVRDHRYRIRLDSEVTSASLQSAQVKIKVEATNIYWEKWIIATQAGFLFALVLGVIGSLTLALDLFVR